jgi:RimJ/RimL family protein N-acetyltransferase
MSGAVAMHHVTRPALAYIVQNMRARDRAEIFALRWDDDEDAFIDMMMSVAGELWRIWTLDDEPVAVTGVVPVRPGVAIGAAFGTDKWRQVVRPMTRWAQTFIIPVLKGANYHRLEAYMLAANTDARRWVEHFGAEIEAVLRGYGRSREDFLLYVLDLTQDRTAQRVARHMKPRRGLPASIGVQ